MSTDQPKPYSLFDRKPNVEINTTPPEGFLSHVQHRNYLAWRIELGVVAMYLVETPLPMYRLKDMVKKLNARAHSFPVQKFPNDLFTISQDKSGLVLTNPNELYNRIKALTGLKADEPEPERLDDTTCFSEELERLFL